MRDGWEKTLPPCENAEKLALTLRLIPAERRADAIQEAWAAALGGECPIKAVRRFDMRERRLAKRTRGLDGLPV
jgi:hypothetical protein